MCLYASTQVRHESGYEVERAVSAPTPHSNPSPTGSSEGTRSWLSRTARSSSRSRPTSAGCGPLDRAAVREDPLENDQPARTQQAQRFSEVVQALQTVAVAEDEVVARGPRAGPGRPARGRG